MFKGMLLSFTSDPHLADSCSARLHRRGWTLRWELACWWFCLKGTYPRFSSVLLPRCFLSFKSLSLIAFILQFLRAPLDLSFFPFLLFCTLHTWHEAVLFIILITFCLLLYLPAGPCNAGESFSSFPQRRPGFRVRILGQSCSWAADSNHSMHCLPKLPPVLIGGYI